MKVGILGAGAIAVKMADTIKHMEGVIPYGVAAREKTRAEGFAAEHGFKKAYGSYEQMVQDADIDLIYVATPHSHHFEHMKLCLENGKNVLCEKSFTVNAAQAKTILDLGRQKKLLVAEAIWTRYLPMRKVLDDLLESGVIGTPYTLTANLCYPIAHKERIIRSDLGGGALLDIGVYPVNFALMTFGHGVSEIDTSMVSGETGVDIADSITFTYADGKRAVLLADARCKGDRRGMIYGDKGYIEFLNINNCEGINVYDLDGKLVKFWETPKQITGFEYQVAACKAALDSGALECPQMPHSEILRVMETMDSIRKIWGLTYDCE